MNKTSIEWCDYTWNPVSGCYHACRNQYCYNTLKSTSPLNRFGARYKNKAGELVYEKDWRKRESGGTHIAKQGEINPYGYDCTFYPHRLVEPYKAKEPGKVFVVDVGDLFGAWVPTDWIEAVLKVTKECSRHTFMFLTKNPKRLAEFKFPDNSYVGTSVNSDRDMARAEILKKVSAPVRFLSIEPLLGPISFDLADFQWIILGAQTGKNAPAPDRAWVNEITRQCKAYKIPIFMKNNIKDYCGTFTQEFPKLK